jgi:hypothetical protein
VAPTPRRLVLILPLLLQIGLLQLGCGASCAEIAETRDRVLRPSRVVAPEGSRPHVRLSVTRKWLDSRLSEAAAQVSLPSISVPVVGRLTFGLSAPRIVEASGDAITVSARIRVSANGRRVADLDASVGLRVAFDASARRLDVTAGSQDRLRVDLSNVQTGLPGSLKRGLLRGASKLLTGALRTALSHAAGRLRYGLSLPHLPLSRVTLQTSGPRLHLDGWLDRPVSQGIRPGASLRGDIALRASMSVVTAATTLAIAQRKLPQRYDHAGNPAADGPCTPTLHWQGRDERPLKLRVFCHSDPCADVTLGGRPWLRLGGGKLRLGVDDAVIEAVDGPPLTRIGLWLSALWRDAISLSSELGSDIQLRLGGQTISLRVGSTRLAAGDLTLGLKAGPAR